MQLEEEAQTILNRLSLMPFDECYPLSREFRNIPTVGGLYAVRHRAEGILYIGLAVSLRRRFRDNGHKAFFGRFWIVTVLLISVLRSNCSRFSLFERAIDSKH